jgi:rSAM/selenodomain-associated transferase 2/rSAM/selenodomain-associated transferase 1
VSLRIVIPVLNEGEGLAAQLRALQPLRARGTEVVVVDGGSTDTTWAIARALADRVLLASRGRATQMNAGAHCNACLYGRAKSPGAQPTALLFLHADTQLPSDADKLILRALQTAHWGRFDVQIDSTHWPLRMVAGMMNLRSRLTGIATGDQAIFVRRDSFEALGGFAPIPLMEDIAFSKSLAGFGAPACLRNQVVTSARRWQKYGVWRTILLMWRLRIAYFFGSAPQALAQRYGYAAAPVLSTAAAAVMAKAPQAGFAKTRLIPLLGATGAARAQRRFTRHTTHTAQCFAPTATTLWCAPHTQYRFFQALLKATGVTCRAQSEGDLGHKMQAIVAQHFVKPHATPLLIMGTDCPLLSPGHLQQAAAALAAHDVVLIPAEDGGYVLIGLRCSVPKVFENITWSTPQVLEQTRQQLRLAGASWHELPSLWDIDEPADWQRLASMPLH